MTAKPHEPPHASPEHAADTLRDERRLGREHAGRRLDQVLAAMFPEHSRARLQGWTREGAIRVDDRQVKPNYRVQGGELLLVDVTLEPVVADRPEAIALSILHEDEHLIVLDKPAGLVVHPAPGNPSGTLLNALLHHDSTLANLPRTGIVHRLDKLTSGVMVVARSPVAHTDLVRQLQARTVSREYRAIVRGAVLAGDTIDQPIGRHPTDRTRMAVLRDGRPAVTHFRVSARFRDFTVLAVRLETGRTHQIRVHLTHRGHPLVGDPVYGPGLRLPQGADPELIEALRGFRRQALHARHLAFSHPVDGAALRFSAPWPEDLRALRAAIAGDEAQHDRS